MTPDDRRAQGADPRLGPDASPSWSRPPGRRRRRFRGTDKRGGANGARHPPRAAEGLGGQRPGRARHGARDPGADPAGVQRSRSRREEGLARRPHRARRRAPPSSRRPRTPAATSPCPFAPGRTDATQEQTDVESFAVLEPSADGFRNYLRAGRRAAGRELLLRPGATCSPDRPGDDRAGRRPAGAGRQRRAVRRSACFTDRPGALTNDFFVNLLDAEHGSGRRPRPPRRLRGSRSRDGRAALDGHRASTSSSARTPSCGPRRGLRVRRRAARSSCATSSPPGSRS